MDRGSPCRGDAVNTTPFERKVLRPEIAPRMKQSHELPRERINPRQVRAFMQIAAVTGQSEIVRVIGAPMLLCHNMLDVMPQVAMFLSQAAIFATFNGASPDKARGSLHPSAIESMSPDEDGP